MNKTKQSVSVSELSKWLDISPRRIQQLVERGVIPRKGRGFYPLAESVAAYIRFIRGGDDKPDLTDWRLGFAKLDLSELTKKKGKRQASDE